MMSFKETEWLQRAPQFLGVVEVGDDEFVVHTGAEVARFEEVHAVHVGDVDAPVVVVVLCGVVV